MKTRENVIRYGLLGQVVRKAPLAETMVRGAFNSNHDPKEAINNGRRETFWQIWNAMKLPEFSGELLDRWVIGNASEAILLGLNSLEAADNYEIRLRNSDTYDETIQVRLIATRNDKHKGQKAVVAVRKIGD